MKKNKQKLKVEQLRNTFQTFVDNFLLS